ncbi:MAG: thymidylate synthase [PVC group bacterium]
MSCYKIIEKDSIGAAWLAAARYVLKAGRPVDFGDVAAREVLNLQVTVRNPRRDDPIVQQYGDQEMIDFMMGNFFGEKSVEEWGYSYRERIFTRDGLDRLVSNLKEKGNSTWSVFTLLRPGEDGKHVPCLTQIQALVREERLCLVCYFRSQDIGLKLYADLLALTEVGEMIKERVKTPSLEMVLHIASAHIYREDIPRLEKILRERPL